MHEHHVPGGTFVHCVDRAGMARTTNTKGSVFTMATAKRKVVEYRDFYACGKWHSKPCTLAQHSSIADLIGETPAMLKLCGRIIALESERDSMTHKAYRLAMRSLRHHIRVMQSANGDQA